MQEKPINFVLCWHMHQPWYQQGIEGDYQLPWVYLHAIKDYTDMAAHLENHPHMHVVVNFAPILLEQLDDYAVQLKEWFHEGRAMRDPLLNALAGVTPVPDSATGRYEILVACQRAHAPRMIDPYPCFRAMLDMVTLPEKDKSPEPASLEQLHYLNEQYFHDLLVWYHLSWLGYSLKQMPEVQQLMNKERLYDEQDRRLLLKIIMDSITEVIPRYRRLAESGQVELSMTPYCHPIIPLLNDFSNMRCAQPEAPTPDCGGYPDGVARSRWHIEQGIRCFERHFGIKPKGVWLSEGGISDDAISLLDEYGFSWTATGEGVWRNSCHASGFEPDLIHSKHDLFSPHIVNSHKARVFFRDDGLSDLIGFEYSDRDASEAVNDFQQHLTNITNTYGDTADQHVISVILDGENAWEYYPDNGFHFI
ncbi:MAG: glycoside hydrolase family 57 protein, partial [Gammaproteobacteria bacterium]|nr:glycoside hydrolase family 57 protein [Gammaproteobacteria bacterium]